MSRLLYLVLLLFGWGDVSARVAPPQDPALVKLLAPQMLAVSRLVVAERWNSRLDELVQRAPAAAGLGEKWNPSAPAWQQARRAIDARVVRLVDAYAQSDQISQVLRQRLTQDFSTPELAQLWAALKGPAGPSIQRQGAMTAFVVEARETTPDSPKPGDPEFFAQLKTLSRMFADRIGTAVPADDRRYEADVAAFSRDPAGNKFSMLWMAVVSKAETTLTGAVNLMLFDDREAIARDIAKAVATIKSDGR